jgi:hypothetical protein
VCTQLNVFLFLLSSSWVTDSLHRVAVSLSERWRRGGAHMIPARIGPTGDSRSVRDEGWEMGYCHVFLPAERTRCGDCRSTRKIRQTLAMSWPPRSLTNPGLAAVTPIKVFVPCTLCQTFRQLLAFRDPAPTSRSPARFGPDPSSRSSGAVWCGRCWPLVRRTLEVICGVLSYRVRSKPMA